MYFIDSNILIGFLRGTLQSACHCLMKSDTSLYKVPAIVKGELLVGVEKSQRPAEERFKVDTLLLPFEIVPFDSSCAVQYARIRAQLEREGRRIGTNDCMIAATAVAHSAVLVTNNVNEFKRVPGLAIECWEEVDL